MLIIAPFAVGCLPQELGDLTNLTVLDMSNNQLTGPLSIRSERLVFAAAEVDCFYAGPLPKVLPNSLEVFNLGDRPGNTNKFTGGIPSEWGGLANLKELKMAACGLDGKPLSIRSERFRFRVDMVTFVAGQLHKELGKLVNLKEFGVGGNMIEGQLSIRTERLRVLLIFTFFGRGIARPTRPVDKLDSPRCVEQ